MKLRTLPAIDYLQQCLDYDPDTGIFIWRRRPVEHFSDAAHANLWNRRYADRLAGSYNHGYRLISIDDISFMAHRIAWLMFYGNLPPQFIDHIDGDPSNNRIDNLRAATSGENLANAKRQKRNGGAKGIWFNARRGKYEAHITVNYKQHYLGRYDTLEEAVSARRDAANHLHGEFARHE